jgi:hypothetical protein
MVAVAALTVLFSRHGVNLVLEKHVSEFGHQSDLYRLYFRNKCTDVSFYAGGMDPEFKLNKSKQGLRYGTFSGTFSGAIMTRYHLGFIFFNGGVFRKTGYGAKFGRGESLVLTPLPDTTYSSYQTAYRFEHGVFTPMCECMEITKREGEKYYGYFHEQDGKLFIGMTYPGDRLMIVNFVWEDGKQRVLSRVPHPYSSHSYSTQ